MREATGSWTNRKPVPSRLAQPRTPFFGGALIRQRHRRAQLFLPFEVAGPQEKPRGVAPGFSPCTFAVDQLAPPVEAVVEANVDHMDLLVEADIPRNGRALT